MGDQDQNTIDYNLLLTINGLLKIQGLVARSSSFIPNLFDNALMSSGIDAFQVWYYKPSNPDSIGFRWSRVIPGEGGNRKAVEWRRAKEETGNGVEGSVIDDTESAVCWLIKSARLDGVDEYPRCVLWLDRWYAWTKVDSYAKSMAALLKSRVLALSRMYRGFPEEYLTKYFSGELLPPQNGEEQWTVTLSIDYRKSTFAMERAIDSKKFAGWIGKSVRIFRKIVEDNGGIFDKFTGDGIIAHFLPLESLRFATSRLRENLKRDEDEKDQPTVAAALSVSCAFELVDAAMALRRELKELVFFDSEFFGAGVGIGVGKASWSCDQDGQPQVVGRGLVDAVRTSDKASSGVILITQHVLTLAKEHIPEIEFSAHPISFESKDLGKEAGALVQRLRDRSTWARSQIEMQKVYAEYEDA